MSTWVITNGIFLTLYINISVSYLARLTFSSILIASIVLIYSNMSNQGPCTFLFLSQEAALDDFI